MNKVRLKSCPFCGKEVPDVTEDFFHNGKYFVFCRGCLSMSPHCNSEDEAAEAWNRRTDCEHCKWWDYQCAVCTNSDSKHCADFTCSDDSCLEWEGKDE